MTFDGYNGNVGIGVTSPANKLEVDGGSAAVRLRISTTGTDAQEAGLILANSSKSAFNDGIVMSHGGGYTRFDGLDGQEIMRLMPQNGAAGNVSVAGTLAVAGALTAGALTAGTTGLGATTVSSTLGAVGTITSTASTALTLDLVGTHANGNYLRMSKAGAVQFFIGTSDSVGGGSGFYDYYAIANKESKISFKSYLKILDKYDLKYIKQNNNQGSTEISNFILTKEKILNYFLFKKILKKKIKKNKINLILKKKFNKANIKFYDKIIVCGYSANNEILDSLGIKYIKKKYIPREILRKSCKSCSRSGYRAKRLPHKAATARRIHCVRYIFIRCLIQREGTRDRANLVHLAHLAIVHLYCHL